MIKKFREYIYDCRYNNGDMTWQSFIQYFNLQFLVIYFTLFNFLYSSSLRTKWSNPLLITRRLQPLACFSLNVNTMGMPKARRGDCHIVIQKSINPHLDYFGLFQVLVMTKMHVIANKVKQSKLIKPLFCGLLRFFTKSRSQRDAYGEWQFPLHFLHLI